MIEDFEIRDALHGITRRLNVLESEMRGVIRMLGDAEKEKEKKTATLVEKSLAEKSHQRLESLKCQLVADALALAATEFYERNNPHFSCTWQRKESIEKLCVTACSFAKWADKLGLYKDDLK